MKNPNDQSNYVFGPSKCGLILRERLIAHQYKKMFKKFLAFYNLSRRTINIIEASISDPIVRNRVRNAYVFARQAQLMEFRKWNKIDEDTGHRMNYVVGEKNRNKIKG